MSVRIALFDDNDNICKSIPLLLNIEPGFEVVGVFNHVLDCIGDINDCKPDIILMDIEMPGMTGIDAVRILRKEFPEVSILMQTVFADDDRVFDSLCAGATGYILKNEINTRLISAIKETMDGGAPMSPSIARKILSGVQQNPQWRLAWSKTPDYRLTGRELQVLNCIVNGLSHKMIGDRLSIGYETVRSHVKKIYEKLQVVSLTEAVAKAIHERLV